VPAFYQQGSGLSYASIWTGLGGVSDTPLIQLGVFAETLGGVTYNQTWYEYVPKSAVLQDFTFITGHSVAIEAWECDASGNYGPNYHGYGCFYFVDLTTNQVVFNPFPVAIQTGFTFTGKTCEGIIERVFISGSPTYLSSWTNASMHFDCWDFGGTTTWNVSTDPYWNISLLRPSDGLGMAWVSKSNPDMGSFTWLRSN
jgi:hypothetical protein